MRPVVAHNRAGITTYGHAEDGLLGLVNVTLGHVDGCEGRKLRKK